MYLRNSKIDIFDSIPNVSEWLKKAAESNKIGSSGIWSDKYIK